MSKLSPAQPKTGGKKSSPKTTAANSVAMTRDEYASVSVRKIDNGYIVSRSHSGPKGYSCVEEFSATKPKLEIPAAKPRK